MNKSLVRGNLHLRSSKPIRSQDPSAVQTLPAPGGRSLELLGSICSCADPGAAATSPNSRSPGSTESQNCWEVAEHCNPQPQMLQLGFDNSSTTLMGLLQTQTVAPSSAGVEDWAVRVDEKLVCGVGMRSQNYNLRQCLW